MPLANINGIELYYEEYGSGDEVIISAQQNFTDGCYREVLAEKGFRVFKIVLRGYGESSHVFEDLGTEWYPTWSSDVRAFAKSQGINQFIYTGVSHGAGVGWQIAQDEPKMLKAFISVVGAPHDRAGGDVSEARKRMIEAAESNDLNYRPPGIYLVPTTDPNRIKRRNKMEQSKEKFFTSMTKEEKLINPRKQSPNAKTNEELAQRLSEIQVPTLLLCACQDDISSAEMSLLAAKSVPGAKAIFYQDHSHVLASEIPEEIAEDIETYLKRLQND
ncbi:alpha/beta fold hydrolase [Halalkalibacter krulwichiae]|uniref:Haloalkane dehalogenase n=1 Tax=Halalkalibacter krulwichiae TaxID=199441 RepID=A0A1X9M8Y3_9BACI|nr:alpha/beta hydrolase [Halalkalibacter krulwichiae]ARK29919.1 haloalkane dehalogenase [Halalkalibacter krulwichiae]